MGLNKGATVRKSSDIHYFRERKVEGVYCRRHMPTMWLNRWDKETGEEVKRNRFQLLGHTSLPLLLQLVFSSLIGGEKRVKSAKTKCRH